MTTMVEMTMQNSTPIELVIFDMAGTTVYDGDAVHRCLASALSEHRLETSREEVNSVMGLSKPVAIRILLERHAAEGEIVGGEEVEKIYAHFLARMIDHYEASSDIREIDGASDAMRLLKSRGIKIALDTGFSRDIVDVLLDRLGWSTGNLLDATVSSDEVLFGRPHPDMVFRAMALTGVSDSARVAKIGDTPSDLHEGTDAGCGLVIGVTQGSHTAHELQAHPHTHLVETVADIPALIFSSQP